MLTLHNTLSGNKETFQPRQAPRVTMYVCGVTPYDSSHLGHGRCYITFDVLFRLLKGLDYEVLYCRNFTDIDDKLMRRAEQELGNRLSYRQIAERYIGAYHQDMRAINCASPTYEPRVTDHIPAIITFIEGLIETGIAYVVAGDVYFHIPAFNRYAQLSKHDLHDLRAGARVEISEQKKDPLDFVLWKGETEGTFWQSPWGWGRPGWHIECSALAGQYLGDHIDIHAGGMDLIFPHHDNEIAQSEALLGAPFARYWLHNAHVQINKEKMSKSLGNYFSLAQLIEEIGGMVVRFYMLTHHYRAPIEFSKQSLEAAAKTYERLCRMFTLEEVVELPPFAEIISLPVVHEMHAFMLDDLNTVGLFGIVFENSALLQQDKNLKAAVRYYLTEILGLTLQPIAEKTVALSAQAKELIAQREEARRAKDWAMADRLRDELKKLGVEVQDKKS